MDVPEAIFSNLGLTYLATLASRRSGTRGSRYLVSSGTAAPTDRTISSGLYPTESHSEHRTQPTASELKMELWLRNLTKEKLTGLRVQNCVMLAGVRGFDAQTSANKLFRPPYSAARSDDGKRWVITAWSPHQRCWGNEKCPCLHSDPKFPDCPPGETERLPRVAFLL